MDADWAWLRCVADPLTQGRKALENDLAAAQQQIKTLLKAAAKRDAQIKRLEKSKAKSAAAAKKAKAALSAQGASLASAQADLGTQAEALATVKTALSKGEAALASAQEDAAGQAAALEQAKAEIAARDASLASAQADLGTQAEALKKVEAQRDQAVAEQAFQARMLAMSQGDLDNLRARYEDSETRRLQQEDLLKKITPKLAPSGREAARAAGDPAGDGAAAAECGLRGSRSGAETVCPDAQETRCGAPEQTRMTPDKANQELLLGLEDTLDLLADYRKSGDAMAVVEPLPSLLEQSQALCDSFGGPEPIRSIHHLACTGGTLISKCLAVLPSVVLLNEIDPLSRLQIAKPGRKPTFSPTDVILGLRHATRPADDAVISEVFRAAIDRAAEALMRRGNRLVLRDHAHSHFNADVTVRPTLRELLLTGAFPVLSLVTVRHPLDSFLSLNRSGWDHFHPFTLEEYSQRYKRFLAHHAGLEIVKYEDFVADPVRELEHICGILDLPFSPLAIDMISAVHLTGDSGRSGHVIAPRSRREISGDIARQRAAKSYLALCKEMGYEP